MSLGNDRSLPLNGANVSLLGTLVNVDRITYKNFDFSVIPFRIILTNYTFLQAYDTAGINIIRVIKARAMFIHS